MASRGQISAFSIQPLAFWTFLSTWHSNEFRTNATIGRNWKCPGIHVLTREHFYHVGSSEDLRHPMVEALITNYAVQQPAPEAGEPAEQRAFFERA